MPRRNEQSFGACVLADIPHLPTQARMVFDTLGFTKAGIEDVSKGP